MDHVNQLLIVYAAYVIATASPGPSNLAIMGVAMRQGRGPALTLALGVMTGSLIWAVLAASGMSALLASYAHALVALKIAGGLYLLYLACRAARSAMRAQTPGAGAMDPAVSRRALYRRGVLLHLTNPKAVLGWMAIMSLGLRPDAPAASLQTIILGCAGLGLIVFGGYALVFSTAPMVRAYQKARRGIEGALALFFGYAGLRLLMSRV